MVFFPFFSSARKSKMPLREEMNQKQALKKRDVIESPCVCVCVSGGLYDHACVGVCMCAQSCRNLCITEYIQRRCLFVCG